MRLNRSRSQYWQALHRDFRAPLECQNCGGSRRSAKKSNSRARSGRAGFRSPPQVPPGGRTHGPSTGGSSGAGKVSQPAHNEGFPAWPRGRPHVGRCLFSLAWLGLRHASGRSRRRQVKVVKAADLRGRPETVKPATIGHFIEFSRRAVKTKPLTLTTCLLTYELVD